MPSLSAAGQTENAMWACLCGREGRKEGEEEAVKARRALERNKRNGG